MLVTTPLDNGRNVSSRKIVNCSVSLCLSQHPHTGPVDCPPLIALVHTSLHTSQLITTRDHQLALRVIDQRSESSHQHRGENHIGQISQLRRRFRK